MSSTPTYDESIFDRPARPQRNLATPIEMTTMMGWPVPLMTDGERRTAWNTCIRIQGGHRLFEPVPGFPEPDARMCKCGRMLVYERAIAALTAWQRRVFAILRDEGWASVLPNPGEEA